MNHVRTDLTPRALRRRLPAAALILAVAVTQAPLGASAMPAPPTPAILLDDGLDGFVNATESTDLYLDVVYDIGHVPPITYAEGRIVGTTGGTPCVSGAPHTTPNNFSTTDMGGFFRIGPFDVSGFPEGATLCGRAFVRDAGNAQSMSGTSFNTSVLDTVGPVDGSVTLVENFIVDGYLNRDEVFSQCCVGANWNHPDAADVDATEFWFEDSTGSITTGCGPWDLGAMGSGSVNATCSPSMAEGTFTWNGIWYDAAGNASNHASTSLIKDSIRPLVSYTSPTSGQGVAPGTTVNVVASTEPFSTLQFRLNNVVIGSDTAAADGSFAFAFQAPATVGTHVFRTIATDLASNKRGTNVSFEVDDLVPVIATPVENALTNGTVTVTGTGRPFSQIRILENGSQIGSTTVDTNGDWVVVIGMPSGPHTIQAVGVEAGAPSSPSLPRSFIVDAGRPNVTITTANGSVQTAILIEGTAADGGAGVASVRVDYYNLLGSLVATTTATCALCGPGATSVNWSSTATLLPGPHTVVVTARDTLGNASLAKTIRIVAGPAI